MHNWLWHSPGVLPVWTEGGVLVSISDSFTRQNVTPCKDIMDCEHGHLLRMVVWIL